MKQRVLISALLLLVLTAKVVSGEPAPEFERWYQIIMADHPAGWMHVSTTRQDQQIESRTQLVITIRRGEVSLQIEMSSTFIETPEGKPIRAASVQKLGTMSIEQEMTFKEDSIELLSRQAGQEQRQTVPVAQVDRDWLPPAAAERYIAKELATKAKVIRYWTVEPNAGPKRIEARMTITGAEKVQVMGKVVSALVCNETMSLMPNVVTKAYIDEKGRPIKTTLSMIPGMEMTIVESDEQLAKAQVDPAELMVATFIKPDKAIKAPRRSVSAVYELRFEPLTAEKKEEDPHPSPLPKKGEGGMPSLPRAGAQRVIWGDDRTARVVVDLAEPVNPVEDLPTADHRRATDMLNYDDPAVKELIAKALTGQSGDLGPAKKAEVLRRFVHHFIQAKDLSVGFATASEVARTGEGDCTEHGVLLAAMLRGAGIPSRTVSGLVYVDEFMGHEGIFGYHMWAQAWISGEKGGYWQDFDAVLDDATPFDATHIALATAAMTQAGTFNDMMKMVPLIGRMKIRVIEVQGESTGEKK